jgi:hypothetical protein
MHFPSLSCGLLLFVLGCGGSPATPSSPTPPTPPPSAIPTLQPGAYYLVVAQGTKSTPSPGGGSFDTWICFGTGTFPTSVQVPLTLEGEGADYRGRAVSGSLLLNLTVSGDAATGTIQGDAADPAGSFSIRVQERGPAGLSGSLSGDGMAAGSVLGNITLIGPEGSGGCSPATWSLVPR